MSRDARVSPSGMVQVIVFQETRPAALSEASRLRKELSRRLHDFRLPEIVSGPLLIAMAEILSNVIKHGNPAPTFINVRVDLLGAQLRLEVRDDGGPFSAFVQRVDGARTLNVDKLSETGRGLSLIGESLNRLSYDRSSVNCYVGWRPIFPDRPLVLVVEDDETLLDMYAHFLSDMRVVKARSCAQARLIISELDVSVIIADLHLLDGLSTSLLQAAEEGWEFSAPIILISGTEDRAGPQDALSRGVELFLAKPVSGSQLRASVDIAILRSARRAAHLARFFARKVDGLLSASLSPFIAGHDIAMARSNASVGGGDLVFEHKLPGRRRIVLLDVMGHGISAKAWSLAFAALCRGLCHAQPLDNCAMFLMRLAEIAWTDRAMDSVVATALVLDLFCDGHIEVASAGHPAPVILGTSSVRQVDVCGTLLGILPPRSYEIASINIQADERLVLVTDGVDSGDVSAGGMLPLWLTDACRKGDFSSSLGQHLEEAGALVLGAQPMDDWTIIVIGPVSGNG